MDYPILTEKEKKLILQIEEYEKNRRWEKFRLDQFIQAFTLPTA